VGRAVPYCAVRCRTVPLTLRRAVAICWAAAAAPLPCSQENASCGAARSRKRSILLSLSSSTNQVCGKANQAHGRASCKPYPAPGVFPPAKCSSASCAGSGSGELTADREVPRVVLCGLGRGVLLAVSCLSAGTAGSCRKNCCLC